MVAASLTEGFLESARQGQGFYDRAAHIGFPEDPYESTSSFSSSAPQGVMDSIVNLTMPAIRFENNETPDDPVVGAQQNLQHAWKTAQTYSKESPKINSYQEMTASGQGLKRTEQQIDNKSAVVQDFKVALAEIKEVQNIQEQAAPQNGGLVTFIGNMALSTMAGAVAETIVPGSNAFIAVATLGAGTFGAKGGASAFKSAADDNNESMYQTASTPEPGSAGAQFNQMMSQGPGFGHLPAQIELMTEPSLEDMSCIFGEEQLAALEIMAKSMEHDVELGKMAFRNHLDATMPVTENIVNIPQIALKLKPEDQLKLTSDNPNLQRDALKNAFVNPGASFS